MFSYKLTIFIRKKKMRLLQWLICSSCLIKKSPNDFGKNKSQPGGKHYYCKECMRDRARKDRHRDPQYYSRYRAANKERLTAYSKQFKIDNPDKINQYRHRQRTKASKDEMKKQRDKELRQKPEYKQKRSQYLKRKYRNNVQHQLRKKFEAKLNYLLAKDDVIDAVTVIGCTIPEYKAYLENRFIAHMSWGNYGSVWEIARVIPFKECDLSKPEEAALCFHYTNSAPLVTEIKNKL
jgi:hypothetical protein